MADNERSEDLNPRNKDIEEKVRQMLDPSIPDEPSIPTETGDKPKSSKITIVDNSASDDSLPQPTAPELPSDDSAKKERKVVVPVSEEDTPVEESDETPTERKIAVTDHGESPEELEQELNKAIAGLDSETPDEQESEPADENTGDDESAPEEADDENQEAIAEETDELDDIAADDENTDEQEAVPEQATKTKRIVQEKTVKETTQKSSSKPAKNTTKSDDIDDPALDKAVSDITAKEKDDIPASPIGKPLKTMPREKKKRRGLRLSKKAVFWSFILLLCGTLAFLTAAPKYRYMVLNKLGVRASSSVTVKDATTGQPLPNAVVRLGDTTATTNQDGYAELGNLLLGDSRLTIEKVAFATVDENYTVGWGSNPLGERTMTPTGVQFTINVKDFLSGGPVASAIASRGDSSANANEDGQIKLTIPNTIENQVTITLSANGYKSLELTTPTEQTDIGEQVLVPAQKQTYIAPDNTIYSAYVDGSERTVLVEPSGFEEPDLVLLPQPGSSRSVYISTRANNRNDQGNLTYNLLLLDSNDGTTKNVALADQFIPHGWIGGHFVYTSVTSGDETAEKAKLQSYNVSNGKVETLATSNYFNDVHIAVGRVYFAPSSIVSGGTEAKLFSVNPDGSDQKTLFDDEVWKLFRNSYEQLAVSVQDEWFQYNIPAKTMTPLADNADNRRQQNYVNAPSQTLAAVITDDNKLQTYHPETRTSDDIVDDHLVEYPIYWFNEDVIVYRAVIDGQLTTYAVSISTGKRTKLAAVAETADNDGWYFY